MTYIESSVGQFQTVRVDKDHSFEATSVHWSIITLYSTLHYRKRDRPNVHYTDRFGFDF